MQIGGKKLGKSARENKDINQTRSKELCASAEHILAILESQFMGLYEGIEVNIED